MNESPDVCLDAAQISLILGGAPELVVGLISFLFFFFYNSQQLFLLWFELTVVLCVKVWVFFCHP